MQKLLTSESEQKNQKAIWNVFGPVMLSQPFINKING